MMTLDHLVIGCTDLAAGAAMLRPALGCDFDAGGRHDGWGTHNRLLSLGPLSYLELIAPDPAQAAPAGERAFGLDTEPVRARIATRPRLLAYVMRCDDIALARAQLNLPPGEIIAMQRGDLRWHLSRPVPGQAAGTPSLIDWGESRQPTRTLPDRGLLLTRLHLRVAASTAQMLAPLAADPRIRIETADSVSLMAEIDTPDGPIRID